ncbi:hypothetical protein H6G76_25810 [Nostoc sp. FACHB-152]|uniref:relaxase/mobilization nuclease domain-containing protein n=1 Tax=Nostoc sp. FACHB-152 TaxID=2692837 RepID=UPI001685DD14|nr:hypothetical protein [Nostoc sp. FACHB-152]MBD2450507.1 hypothetical protein [Nostoc sp. FACHB-152]
MKMTIQESAIDDFNMIHQLSQNRKIGMSSFPEIEPTISQVITNFQNLAQKRPKLRKPGIYTQISLKNIYFHVSYESCHQIVTQYIQGICWHDLQYVCFFDIQHHNIYIHIIFNRVTPEGNLIDIRCLGATWQQYEVLRKSCSQIFNSSQSFCFQNPCF